MVRVWGSGDAQTVPTKGEEWPPEQLLGDVVPSTHTEDTSPSFLLNEEFKEIRIMLARSKHLEFIASEKIGKFRCSNSVCN